jgi:ribosomal protein S18 acetylase RimI-like enzyme
MLDKSLPYTPLMMTKTDTENYPKFDLPEGYSFRFYQAGDEEKWAALECALGQFNDTDAALRCFQAEFILNQDLKPEDRMIFVLDPAGKPIATAALWDGIFLGEKKERLHWIAVSDACAGKGIAKAMISRLLALYNELGFSGFLYLHTSTHSYQAIGIYKKFGFAPYLGEKSPFANVSDEEFPKKNLAAWALVDEKHMAYKKGM